MAQRTTAWAEGPEPLPSVTGQTGLISMPDARLAPDGTWRTGYSFDRPYFALWSSISFMPWFEASFRFSRIEHVPAFPDRPDTNYGDYKDKSFDVKLRLLDERQYWPQIALGAQDAGGGTDLFPAAYAVASKRFGEFDLSLGYGTDRIDGAFGGIRWQPQSLPHWSLVAEYNAYNYALDHGAALSGAIDDKKGAALGLEYHQDYWGAKLFTDHGDTGVNAWVSIPLEAKEFIPKIDEPAPYTKINPRPTEAQWLDDPAHEARLRKALEAQGYANVRTRYVNGTLEASLSNPRISSVPRAVGRAARTMLAFAPLEVRELRVTYQDGVLRVATYEFADPKTLQRYFNGMASRDMLVPTVSVEYADPKGIEPDQAREQALAAAAEPLPEDIVIKGRSPERLLAYEQNLAGGRFVVRPTLSFFFNDPSGAAKYDLSALFSWDRQLASRTFFNSELKATISENVSDVTQPSDSDLPHVRTDIALYKRGSDFKLLKAMVNHYEQPDTRVYARFSAGIYEEMYSGAGGQVLWLSPGGGIAADLAVDALQQRDYDGWFGHLDYQTVTAIASLHYHMSQGLTATLRAGRFLAKDEGVRMEVKRRFASGFEVGAWYTVTNGNDITPPGSPGNPYYDKGIFMRMSLDAMLTRDTRAVARMSLSPWTRDVGQMVESPNDLAQLLERDVVTVRDGDGLRRVGDMDDDPALPQLGADRRWPDFLAGDAAAVGSEAGQSSWADGLVLGTGIVLASALLDHTIDDYAKRHQDSKALQRTVKLGNALPIAAIGISGIFALDDSRSRLQDTSIAALEAGGLAIVGTEVVKRAVGRARPDTEQGAGEFQPFSNDDAYHSFPSRHAAVMWAAVTPYAKEYDMPWLYGVAAITNLGRAASREHWFSDTVAGSLLGYWLGTIAWEARREARLGRDSPRIGLGVDHISVAWDF